MMKNVLRAIAVFGALALGATSVFAAGASTSKKAPDLASVRAKIEAENYAAAIAELTPMLQSNKSADVYNLMGYSLRKSGDLEQAATFYNQALALDPEHLGALEYQGELFLELGDIGKAKENLEKLAALCPQGCEERDDLERNINNPPAATTN